MPEYKDYTIAWMVSLATEYCAAQHVLDVEHERLDFLQDTFNIYTLGRIGVHNVVVVYGNPPEISTEVENTASMADETMRIFPGLELCVIGGTGFNTLPLQGSVRLGDALFCSATVDEIKANILEKHRETARALHGAVNVYLTKCANREYEADTLEVINKILTRNPDLAASFRRPDLLQTPPPQDSPGPLEPLDESSIGKYCSGKEVRGMIPSVVIRGICGLTDGYRIPDWEGYAALASALATRNMLHELPRLL